MTTVPADALAPQHGRATLAIAPAIAVAAFASIGAGAIHAAAIGVHSEHREAVITFTLLAIVQIGWGALSLVNSSRALAISGALANAAAVGGFVLAKTSGIWFVAGLDEAEGVQLADGMAAALAGVAVIGVVVALASGMRMSNLTQSTLFMGALVTALLTVPAMVAAGSHSHAGGGHSHGGGEGGTAAAGHTHGDGEDEGDGHSHAAAVVPPKAYDPTKPIDLGGVEGVTPEQQARAENLIAITLARLPKYADYRVAEANGFKSIGDGFTGDEHFINTAYFDDGRILDPDYPESLVYQPQPDGSKKLRAAMFMLGSGTTLETVPDVGGKLTQWHIHNNLCFTTGGQVAGLTDGNGGCSAPLVKGPEMPMIHVWITSHPCGPFAALEGVGAGQIKEGEERLCDHAHGAGGF
jgi:hypothetical protein